MIIKISTLSSSCIHTWVTSKNTPTQQQILTCFDIYVIVLEWKCLSTLLHLTPSNSSPTQLARYGTRPCSVGSPAAHPSCDRRGCSSSVCTPAASYHLLTHTLAREHPTSAHTPFLRQCSPLAAPCIPARWLWGGCCSVNFFSLRSHYKFSRFSSWHLLFFQKFFGSSMYSILAEGHCKQWPVE